MPDRATRSRCHHYCTSCVLLYSIYSKASPSPDQYGRPDNTTCSMSLGHDPNVAVNILHILLGLDIARQHSLSEALVCENTKKPAKILCPSFAKLNNSRDYNSRQQLINFIHPTKTKNKSPTKAKPPTNPTAYTYCTFRIEKTSAQPSDENTRCRTCLDQLSTAYNEIPRMFVSRTRQHQHWCRVRRVSFRHDASHLTFSTSVIDVKHCRFLILD